MVNLPPRVLHPPAMTMKQVNCRVNHLLILTLPMIVFSSQSSALAQSANQSITQVNASFICVKAANKWTTVVQTTSRPNENVAFIVWESNAFATARLNNKSYDNQNRCQLVSTRLNSLFQKGQLEFITSGTVGGQPVICGTRSNKESCTPDNIIFTLRKSDQANAIIKQFYDLQRGLSNQPIYQTKRLPSHINMREVILRAPQLSKAK